MRVILGTMMMGGAADAAASRRMLEELRKRGLEEVDTALMYCGGNAERVLGELGTARAGSGFRVATKANPWFRLADESVQPAPCGGLEPAALRRQVELSLGRLFPAEEGKEAEAATVDLLYLHAPDHATPVEETLAAVAELHRAGRFREWGLSNYAAWEVADIVRLCDAKGWPRPTVYQGMYNALTREVEAELLPCLRHFGLRFYAYNPLAGGLLTGAHRAADNPEGGRFSGATYWGQQYRNRYWKPVYFDALDRVQAACAASGGIPVGHAALRWLRHHSALAADDGIIVGGSRLEHVVDNLDAAVCADPLPAAVVEAFDAAWAACKGDCPRYFR